MGALLETPAFRSLQEAIGAPLITALVREELARLREGIEAGSIDPVELERAVAPDTLASAVRQSAERLLAPSPRVVVNATGVVVHTNLGRSVLSPAAAARVATAATRYMDLEYDLGAGERGRRSVHLEPLLGRLFPGRAGLVVGNNAAAILLALQALARGREVVVSRGELVEIGGGFRVPEILRTSGARLREVGTTNRTRASDYQEAVGAKTGAILKVHTSNFRIVGFTEDAPIAELAAIARAAGLPLVVDAGSGDLVDLAPLGILDEVPVQRALEDGADLVTFSGDKLLGGPQAGFVVGRADLVSRLARHPLARAVRLDRILIGAVRETLAAHLRGRALEEIPTLRMLALDAAQIGERAARVLAIVQPAVAPPWQASLVDGTSRPGGGSSPAGERPTRLLRIGRTDGDAGALERRLRASTPPVIARLQDGALLLDLRTVLPDEDEVLAAAVAAALRALRR